MHKSFVVLYLSNVCYSIVVLSGIVAPNCDHCWTGTLERAVNNFLQWATSDATATPVAPPAVKRRNRRQRRRRVNNQQRGHSNSGYNSDNRTTITYVADTIRSSIPSWDNMVFGDDQWSGSEANSNATSASYELMVASSA